MIAPRNFLNFGSTHGAERYARYFLILVIHVLHPTFKLIFHVFLTRDPPSVPFFATAETNFGATLSTRQLCGIHICSFNHSLTGTLCTPANERVIFLGLLIPKLLIFRVNLGHIILKKTLESLFLDSLLALELKADQLFQFTPLDCSF